MLQVRAVELHEIIHLVKHLQQKVLELMTYDYAVSAKFAGKQTHRVPEKILEKTLQSALVLNIRALPRHLPFIVLGSLL